MFITHIIVTSKKILQFMNKLQNESKNKIWINMIKSINAWIIKYCSSFNDQAML